MQKSNKKSNNNVVKNGKNKNKNNKKPNNVFTSTYDRSVVMKKLETGSGRVNMSRCALKYAMAICRPFSPEAQGACIPSTPAQPTHKVAGFIRGDGFIGTGGIGYVIVHPCVASDLPSVFATSAAFTQTSLVELSAVNALAAGVVPLSMSNLPYSGFELANNALTDGVAVTGRIVSCGVTIQYTGTALNESGMVYLTRDPGHENVTFASGTVLPIKPSELGAFTYTELCPFTREKCAINDYACKYTEMNFSAVSPNHSIQQARSLSCYPFSNGTHQLTTTLGSASYEVTVGGIAVPVGQPTMCIAVTGVAGQSFHFEVSTHVEYIGSLAQASLTPSESDGDGAGVVLTAANQIPQRKSTNPRASYWDLMYDGLAYAAKKAAPVVIPALEKAALSLIA